MSDIIAITAGIQSIKLAIDIAKDLRSVTTSYKDAEIKLKIADLFEALAEAKMQLVDTQEENFNLKKKIKELEKSLSKRDEVIFKDGYYYAKIPEEGKPTGPFCPNCYTKYNRLSILTKQSGEFLVFGEYLCPGCDKNFGNKQGM